MDFLLAFAYIAAAALVAAVALLWGGQEKITGASLLIGSIILSNVLYAAYRQDFFSKNTFITLYIVIDVALVVVFLALARRSGALDGRRWAVALAGVHLAMLLNNVDFSAYRILMNGSYYGLVGNVLTIIALVVCLIAFSPKSRDEAVHIILGKLRYIESDIRHWFGLWGGPRFWARLFRIVPSELDIRIGAKIREARLINGLQRAELAQLLGVSVPQVQKYETGRTRIGAAMLFQLAQHFNIGVSFFYEEPASAQFAARTAAKPT